MNNETIARIVELAAEIITTIVRRACHRHLENIYQGGNRRIRGYQIPYLQRILEQGNRIRAESGVPEGKRERSDIQRGSHKEIYAHPAAERQHRHRTGRNGMPAESPHGRWRTFHLR